MGDPLLVEVVGRLVRLGARAVVLFGSRARGDWGPWSDYDLLILGDFGGLAYLERIRLVLDTLADIPLPVEPHPYTLQEALAMLERGSPTIIDALEEGVVLHDSGDLGILRARYEDLKRRGLSRSKTTIILPQNAGAGDTGGRGR